MSFSSAFLEKIKTSVKISDIASRHVNWDLKKSNTSKQDFWAPCPFHQEKTASFHVDDTKGFYYCFGCQAKGNIFTFLNEMEGVSFFDAVKALSEMAGIPLEIDDDKKRMTTSNEEQRLININEIASEFFRKYLFSTKGSIALSYLRDRGLSLEIIKEFQLGFSPSRPDDLTNFLKSQGYNEQFIEKSGLAFKPENKPLVDRFRNRIMFPISDSNNNIVAFGGRSLNTAYGAKYINSSETKIFKKGSLLFNLKNAQKSKKNDPLIVVEGYMDVISLANNSIKNAVAPLGTSMTKEQLQLIWRACEEPILLLDGDNAGKLATSRAVDLALPLISYNQTLRIANLPTNYDPDDLLKQHGKDALKDVIENSQTLSEFIFTNEKSQRKIDSPERLRKLHVELTRKIQKIKDFSLKKMFLAEMNDKIRKTQYPSQTDTKRSSSPMLGDNKINIKKKTMSRVQASEKEIEMLEAEIMFCLIKNPTFIKDFKETLTDLDFSDEFFQKSLWKIQHEPFSKTTEICISISSQATKKNPTLKNHLIYNDQKKQEMSRNLLMNRITTLNLAKNRLESLKDLKIKIKTQESDSPYQNESLEKIQREYHRAIGGSQFVEDSILREREFDKGSLDIFKKIKEKSSERNNG
tara:strand:- start:612 stop:2519 length:1908 start_codon:yes stop_codon:yes gene_type:complete